jgi:CHASE3 domain sensor protein
MQLTRWRIGQQMALGFVPMIASLLSIVALSVWKQLHLLRLT